RPLPARASTDHRPPMRVALPPSCAPAPRRVVAYPSNPADPCWELACSARPLGAALQSASGGHRAARTSSRPAIPTRVGTARAPRAAGVA
ncbi:hypothetical protein PVAP13_8KG028551, partial [Panicum virgatum]